MPRTVPYSSHEPEWVSNVLWWQVYPLGFVGAPIEPDQTGLPPVHRLERIANWLGHLLELGLNGLLLGPVFTSSTHGYDTTDYFTVDPRLGDEHDLIRLIDAAHRRGVRVLLDGVFNHVSRAHPGFMAAEGGGPETAGADLFRIRWDGWHPGDPIDADVFEGHSQLVELDHGSPAVEELVVDVMTYWLDRGIDGWRLDAAYAIPPAFWARVLPRLRARHPEAWFLGEVIHGDYAQIVAESTIDTLTQYELWQGIWHGIADRNLFELAHAIERHNRMLAAFVPNTFIGNHDVTRIASAVGPELLPHSLAVLLTIAGTPSLYAGDEYGYEAVKENRRGGDDAIRPEFPPAPPSPEVLSAAAIETIRLTNEFVAVRRRHPWVHRSPTDVIDVTNTTIVLRTAQASEALVTALNIGERPARLPTAGATGVLAGSATITGRWVQLPAHGWAILG
jgi:glycosidase